MNRTLVKGDRVRARWYDPKLTPPASLAGVQLKFEVTNREVVGVVTHIRGDDPVAPKSIGIWIQPDAGGPEVSVDSKFIVEVLPQS